MAHVVPKREPCFKCKNPVFLAERLVVGTKLYHRCCLKCARCKTLLTIGSFYETENDGEYVCDVCPDEEKKIEAKKSVDLSSQRLSIAQKIAMFEKDTSNVLKKSLSDEEKSKSLNRQNSMTSSAAITLKTTPNTAALNSFMSEQVNQTIESDDDNEAADLSLISTSSDDNEVEPPPPTVPGNHPTHKVSDKVDYAITSQQVPMLPTLTTRRFTKELTPNMDSEFEDILNSYGDEPEVLNESQLDSSLQIDLDFDQLMGKDESTDVTNNSSDKLVNFGLEAQVTHSLNVKVNDEQINVKNDIVEMKEVVLEEPLKELEVVEAKEMEKEESLDVVEVKEEVKKVEEVVDEKLENQEVVVMKSEFEVPESEDVTKFQVIEVERMDAAVEIESNVSAVLEVAESKEVAEQVESNVEQLDVLEVPEAQSNEVENFKVPEIESKEEEVINDTEDGAKNDDVLNIKYPICLNPFDDEEQVPAVEEASTNKDPKRPSLNPFGSSDDDDGINDDDIYPKRTMNSGTLPKPPRPPLPKTMTMGRMSTNPFGDSDEESHVVTQSRTPVPTPRKIV